MYNSPMIGSSDLVPILREFAGKRNSCYVNAPIFTEYLHKYSRRYFQQSPELAAYMEIGYEVLLDRIRKLNTSQGIDVMEDKQGNTVIFVPHFFIDKISQVYKEMDMRKNIPFPLASNLPPNFTGSFIRRIKMNYEFTELDRNADPANNFLYALSYDNGIPAMVFPGSFNIDQILKASISKLQLLFDKDESLEFFQKRLFLANPGREISIKTFLSGIRTRAGEAINNLKSACDSYILWGQLCSLIKQELMKKAERLVDEVSLLQAVGLIEVLNNYYRSKIQKKLQVDTALKNLNLAFQKSPYCYTMQSISEFSDSRGVPLLGQYSEKDLQNFMQTKTNPGGKYSIPEIVSFKNQYNERFYIAAEKVIPLIISLIPESRSLVKEVCLNRWQRKLKAFEQEPAMKNNAAFSNLIKSICENSAPNLYSLLNASFIQSLVADKDILAMQAAEIGRLFPHGEPAPYNDILMLSREELYNDTKIKLPFWYAIPILFSIVAFFKKPKPDKAKSKNLGKDENKSKYVQPATFKETANKLSHSFLQKGSTIDEGLQKYLDLWNTNLDPTLRANLTEDINSLIRDYIKGVQKTMTTASLTKKRVSQLAYALVSTPSLTKIKDQKSLQKYIELYILKIIQNYF